MNRVNDALVRLLAVSTGCQESSSIELTQSEWKQLYEDAIAHQIYSIIYEEASKYGNSIFPELFTKWKNATIIQVLSNNRRFSVITDLLKTLENNNIPVMVLKGLHYKYS
jgi:hypothetical protein